MASPSVVAGQAEEVLGEIRTLDSKFRKSCDQILLLNNQIEDLQVRYDRALGSNRRSYRYSIRLRLATLEGVRNMFYEYAHHCANKLEELQNYLFITGREPYASVDGEWEPVSSEDEAEMSMYSTSSVTRSPARFTSSDSTSRFQFQSSSSNGNPNEAGPSGPVAGMSSFSGFSSNNLATQSSTSARSASNNAGVTGSSVSNISQGYNTTHQRSVYNHLNSPSQSSYLTSTNLVEQDSLLDGPLSTTTNAGPSTEEELSDMDFDSDDSYGQVSE